MHKTHTNSLTRLTLCKCKYRMNQTAQHWIQAQPFGNSGQLSHANLLLCSSICLFFCGAQSGCPLNVFTMCLFFDALHVGFRIGLVFPLEEGSAYFVACLYNRAFAFVFLAIRTLINPKSHCRFLPTFGNATIATACRQITVFYVNKLFMSMRLLAGVKLEGKPIKFISTHF